MPCNYIGIEEALREWKRKCHGMGIPIGTETLYTLLFADDQVIIASDMDDAGYMLRKLIEQYGKWGLTINISKTEYLAIGGNEMTDLAVENGKVKGCKTYKYLGVTFTSNGRNTEEVKNKIGQGKRAIRQINSVLWNDKITKKTKHMIYHSIVESIATYGAEVWELNKRDQDRLLALEMDFWRRSSGTSRLEHKRNDEIRQNMEVEKTIIDTIETKHLLWYGRLERMEETRWPKKVWQWTPQGRRRRGRPVKTWSEGVQDAMTARGLQEGDWADRARWKSGSEKRRQP